MKRLLTFSAFVVFFASCNHEDKTTNEPKKETGKNRNQTNDTLKTSTIIDTTPRITGVGGIFFFSDDPKKTREWYAANLGINVNDYGAMFESRDLNNPGTRTQLQWTPFKKGDAYFSPSKKDFMINYRVQNLEGLLNKLKKNGVTILDTVAAYDFGKFVHIMDKDGNKIELWEPVENGDDNSQK
jgi:predicted enzyme related to lactoylglutathione lyase